MTPAPKNRGAFLLVSCQGGAEEALCQRQQAILPELTKGAWRRGAVTFRLPSREALPVSPSRKSRCDPPDDFFPDLIFARAVIRSFGQVTGASDQERIKKLRVLANHEAFDNIHVWQRDPRTEVSPDSIRKLLLEAFCQSVSLAPIANPGDLVLDCVVDSVDRWWVGWHRAKTPASCWPGGVYPQALPEDKVSRAWLKLDEALVPFGLTLPPGNRACELGASPGGACQRLLEAGLSVVGIDPALVDQRVAAESQFEQWRMRARDVQIRMFRGFDWIVADMNIDPTGTLESIERIVNAPGVRPAGIIATLKLPEWSRASALPEWLNLFRAWGFNPHVRQLSSGGKEVCVVALKNAALRKSLVRKAILRRASLRKKTLTRTPDRAATQRPDRSGSRK